MQSRDNEPRVEQWDFIEITLHAPIEGNPFRDTTLRANFTLGARTVQVDGFFDADGADATGARGIFRIRFMPDAQGAWTWRTHSNVHALDNQRGAFQCIAPSGSNRGPVRVRAQYHFAYANGDPYFPFGTTLYAWAHQTPALIEQTLATLRTAPFNKVRMCIFPKHYLYNSNEPALHPFARAAQPSGASAFDTTRFNPAFWRHLEQRIDDLRALGIEADLILFHPYDRWGYADMSPQDDLAYLRYAVARLAAYRNVWWSMANEYDFLLDVKPLAHWDALFATLRASDPYARLTSIHNGRMESAYNHTHPWISHASVQSASVRRAQEWRTTYAKPVINDECEYEGNIPIHWGNISARELVHRIWWMVASGCYVSHGETFMAADEVLWWAKGGLLHGESAPRIAFLRRLLQEDVQTGLTPLGSHSPWHAVAASAEGDYRLFYFAEHQPAIWTTGLPAAEGDYTFDVIDPWQMTITPAARCDPPRLPTPRGVAPVPPSPYAVRLPAKPNLALRVRKAS